MNLNGWESKFNYLMETDEFHFECEETCQVKGNIKNEIVGARGIK